MFRHYARAAPQRAGVQRYKAAAQVLRKLVADADYAPRATATAGPRPEWVSLTEVI